MLATGGIYAVKKRKKPIQKIPKPPPTDGVKSNPSKRHRDRLNSELDKLTSLLPFSEDVRARLDKLSVLRLSVGYLKVKSYFNATMKKNNVGWLREKPGTFGGDGQSVPQTNGTSFSEGDLLLQALNGFVLVVTAEGYVFYSSPTIQDYLGFHQSDVVHQSVFELIHTDDRAMFRRQLHFALNPNSFESEQGTELMQSGSNSTGLSNIVNYDPQLIPPENSSFLERSFCCRFRCLLDNSSGFLALNFQGRLKFLHGQNKLSEDGTLVPSQLALFAIGTPLQPPSILEIRTKTLIFQTKHKLDFTPMGCDTRGKVVLGYTETELCMRGTGYQFIHAADMMYCADNHVRMIKTGESGLTVFRLLTKNGSWVWVQANARLIYKGGRPDFIVARQRALSNEEGEEHLRQRTLQLPFNFATGEAVLYETGSTGDDFSNIFPATNKKGAEQKSIDPNSLLGARLKQDQSIYVSHAASVPQYSLDKAMDDTTIVNVLGDPWIPGNHRQNANIKEESETLAMMEALEKLFNGNDLQHVDGLELKHWEETLFKMDINNSEMSLELNDILNNDIFAYVEDALFKEQCKPNNNGKDNGRSSINSLANQMDSIGVVQPNLFEGQLLNGFVEQFGKQTCSQLPQDQTLQDFQKPPLQSFQATQMDLNQQLLSAHQISTQPNQVGMDEPSLEGFQGFLQAGPQNHIGLNVSNDMQPRLQQQSPANLNTPNSFVHFSSQDSMELNANSQLQFGQTLAGPCAQNLMGHSLQQNAVGSRGLFDHGQPQIPQNNMDGYSQNQITPNPQANNGQPNPLALQSQLQKSQLMPAQQLLNPMSSTEDSQWVTSTSNTNYTQNHQQVPMSAQNELQRDLLSLPQNTLMMNQLPKQHHHQANLVQRMQQLQPQAVTQNGQLYPTESHQERVLGVQPIVSYSQTQELQSIPQISSLLAQNSPFQQCGLGFGPQQISKVYQTPVGSAGLPSTSSCMFKSNSSPPMNGVQFSSMEHSTPSCLNIKPPPNQIPLQASCYYQTKPSEPIVGTTVIAQDDISISPPSCQFQPGFPPEILLEQCFINCNGQTPQPGHPMEENGELPYTALPNGNTYFPKHSGQANCCDY
ncbi:aryl hydrocarbon receptor-like [Acipenser ruthenus]|uniref:aryl hydrocarbon receptor-like n=1 Tax=Acipenser ruthenus TaxID=7906 RepID=UPI00145AA950|nr:aryl hydrocarbon receptor-like [Acipenser ruthenus]